MFRESFSIQKIFHYTSISEREQSYSVSYIHPQLHSKVQPCGACALRVVRFCEYVRRIWLQSGGGLVFSRWWRA
jgi:hypothetical protein